MSNELTPDMGALFPRLAWRCYRNERTQADGDGYLDRWTVLARFARGLCQCGRVDRRGMLNRLSSMNSSGGARIWMSGRRRNSGARSGPTRSNIYLRRRQKQYIAYTDRCDQEQPAPAVHRDEGKLEACRRDHRSLAGICHFNAVDTAFSAQGVLDVFYEQKYATAEQWLQTNGDTIIMTSLDFDNRCYRFGDPFDCTLSVSDYSHPALKAPALEWSMIADGEKFASERSYEHTPYQTCPAGSVQAVIPDFGKPVRAKLIAKLTEDGRVYTNEWDLWFFPTTEGLPEQVIDLDGREEHTHNAKTLITSKLTPELAEFVNSGGNLILFSSEGLVRPFLSCLGLAKGKYYFTKPANFPPFEELQAGTIIQNHPMFGDFPHEGFADLQFYNMLGESPAFDIGPLGLNDEDPVIRMMHSSMVARPWAPSSSDRWRWQDQHDRAGYEQHEPRGRLPLRQIACLYLRGDKPACAE